MLLRRLKFLGVIAGLLVVVGGGTYLLAPQWLMQLNQWREASAADLSTRHVQIGDTQWTYYEGGNGPTIVLVHGFDADRSIWLPVAKVLTRNFHVVIPDLPGWGQSTRLPGADYGIDAQAARLDGFVHTLQLSPMLLVGHSMGGAIAGVFAAEHPDKVAGLVLMDSFGLTFKKNAFVREVESGTDPFVFDDRAGFQRMEKLVFEHPPAIPGRFVDVLVKHNVANRAFVQRLFKRLQQPGQYDALDKRLGKLSMPVLGLWCRDDKVIDISALDTLRNGLTHASSIGTSIISGCGHVPEIEKPAATAQLISGFAISH